MKKRVALLILDGWGHGDKSHSDAIYNAPTPFMDSLEKNYPNAELITYGREVGLPIGQMGNSEVGHLNIGAGRIVYQELTRINKVIEEGEFQEVKALKETMLYAKQNNKPLHLLGLVSSGGVHSAYNHLLALCDMALAYELPEVYIHAFMDGRDCNPKEGAEQIAQLEQYIEGSPIKIVSVIGRYYAMDRDNRWERIKEAYDLLVHGKGERFEHAKEAILASYESGITDEFILPKVIAPTGEAPIQLKNGDAAICFNFRTDRCREITTALTQRSFPNIEMSPLNLHYATMTNYDKTFQNIHVIFEKDNLKNTLGEVLAENNKSQIRIAETEKYPHVSFFFSGGKESEFRGERRIMIPSPKVATYDLQPEMSANEIKDAILNEMQTNLPDFICLNFANTDMVGHTGVYEAIQKAATTVDACVQEIVEIGKDLDYSFVIIADHGNSDFAVNEDGSPNTAHSMNPVPIIVIDEWTKKVNAGSLKDVAPTILNLMGIAQPEDMTGINLAER
jgi:2,3-bisphosphoglycerate-independent phosphoglycerate mutase